MPNYLIYIRKNNGICQKIAIHPDETLKQLKKIVTKITNTDKWNVRSTLKGIQLRDLDDNQTVRNSGIPNNAILEVISSPTQDLQQFMIQLCFADLCQKTKFEPQAEIKDLRSVAAQKFHKNPSSIEFQIHGSKIFNDSVRLNELGLKIGDRVFVLEKKVITNLFEGSQNDPSTPEALYDHKFEDSIASSDDFCDSPGQDDRFFRKEYRSQIIKKISDYRPPANSLKKIEEEQRQAPIIKRSAIISSNMCSEFLNSPNIRKAHHDILNLNEIRETMSFGSLEDSVTEEVYIQIFSEDRSRYYRLECMPECQGWQIRNKLANIERVSPERIQIGGFQEKQKISLYDMSPSPSLSQERINKGSDKSYKSTVFQFIFKIIDVPD